MDHLRRRRRTPRPTKQMVFVQKSVWGGYKYGSGVDENRV